MNKKFKGYYVGLTHPWSDTKRKWFECYYTSISNPDGSWFKLSTANIYNVMEGEGIQYEVNDIRKIYL